jgi:hypothetical protein
MEKTILHYLGYLFVGFAHLTDKDLSEDEQSEILYLLRKWGGDETAQNGDLAIKMSEIMLWYEKGKDIEEKQKQFIEVADSINAMEFFDKAKKREILQDLIRLSAADGFYKEWEIKWINTLAQTWNIKLKIELPE